jgi:hypothetical protein
VGNNKLNIGGFFKMELIDLVGRHKLTGVEFGQEQYGYSDDSEYIMFILDGVTYLAKEDPDDGYGSYMGELEVTDKIIKNKFDEVEVFCMMREEYASEVLEIYDTNNDRLILAVGTENTDDWYPWFECKYYPENMFINDNN